MTQPQAGANVTLPESRICGVVTRRARAGSDTAGRAWVSIVMTQGGIGGIVCRVSHNYGTGNAARATAGAVARRLQPGVRVIVHANTIGLQTRRQCTELVLDDATLITLADPPAAHHTTEKAD